MSTLSATHKWKNWFAIDAKFQRRAKSGGQLGIMSKNAGCGTDFKPTLYTRLVEYFT